MPYNRPEDRQTPDDLASVTPGMLSRLDVIKREVQRAAEETGLPGWINGPADAFRHAYLAGRLRQEFGLAGAQAILAVSGLRRRTPRVERLPAARVRTFAR